MIHGDLYLERSLGPAREGNWVTVGDTGLNFAQLIHAHCPTPADKAGPAAAAATLRDAALSFHPKRGSALLRFWGRGCFC